MWDTIKDLLKTRGVQLLSRYVGIGASMLGTKLGVELPPDGTQGFSTVVALFVVGGLCLAIDLWSHKKQAEAK